MRKRIRHQSLRVQLIVVICLIMFPMNLLLLFYSSLTIKNVEERITVSYNNEMDVLQRRFDNLGDSVKNEFNGFILDYIDKFRVDTELDRLSIIHMLDDLKVIWQKLDLMSGAYIKLRSSGAVHVSHDANAVSYANKEELTKTLEATPLSEFNRQQLTITAADGKVYLLWNCVYGGYNESAGCDFGFFIPADALVQELRAAGANDSEEVYITNLSGNILTGSTGLVGSGTPTGSTERTGSTTLTDSPALPENISEILPGNKAFSMKTDSLDFQVYRLVPEELIYGTVPLTERMLQMIAIIALVLIPVLWLTIRRLVLKPMERMNHAMMEIEKDHIDYRLQPERAESAEFQYMENTFNHMVSQIQNLRIEKYETELEKMEIQSINILLQVNPHLLLNSLNMICSLAKIKDYNTIQKFGRSLAAYFRYALRNHDQMVTLKDEMLFVKNYLDIQRIRYPKRFTSVYSVEESLDTLRIPSLLIENFVENSIKYALKPEEEIEIIITARREEEKLVIAIIDSGNGMDEVRLEKLRRGEVISDKIGNHIGIWNLRRRLHLIYGDDAVINISSVAGEGTQVWIKIPIKTDSAAEQNAIKKGDIKCPSGVDSDKEDEYESAHCR